MTFDLMVGAAMMMIGLSGYYAWRWFRRKQAVEHPLFLALVVFTGVYGMVAIEAGWITAEVGRAPWILWGVMKTVDAVTESTTIPTIFWFFVAFYSAIGIAAVSLLRWYFRKHPLIPAGENEQPVRRPAVQEAFSHD